MSSSMEEIDGDWDAAPDVFLEYFTDADPQGGQPQMIDYHNPQQDVMYLPNGQQGHAPMQQFPGGASNAALQQHMLQQQLQYQLQIQQMMLAQQQLAAKGGSFPPGASLTPGATPQTPTSPPFASFVQEPQVQFTLPMHELPPEQPAPLHLLQQAAEAYAGQNHQLELLKQKQRQLLSSKAVSQQDATAILNEQLQIKNSIDTQIQTISQLHANFILPPADLTKVYYLHQELQVQLKQLELLYRELNQDTSCYAALVIVRQPFPEVISKNKQLTDDALTVKLLTGSTVQVKFASPVKCSILNDVHQTGKGAQPKPIENDEQNLDSTTRTAHFPLKFNQGSRKSPVSLRFGVQVQLTTMNGMAINATIESPATEPFIVITNESQWEDSEQVLLRKDIFGGMVEVPWLQFCNTLQRHFLKATRQDPLKPKRALSRFDFKYIHRKFFQKPTLNQKQFDEFWSWFGKHLQIVRYQRHINPMWQNGLLYGFMTREEVDAALSNQIMGTFVIRLSERYSGQLAIAFVGSNKQIRHYLVAPNDTAGAKKTLPDFLAERREFAYILQVSFDTNGRPIFRRYPKDQCFAQYYSPQHNVEKPASDDGYEPLENAM